MVKSTLREIRTSLTRYLAIFAIAALGVGFFSGLKICRDSMVKTASDYLTRQNFYDYQINSSYGIDDESVSIAGDWDGISEAEGSIRRDVLVRTGDGDSKAMRAISMPKSINRPDPVEGRLPRNVNECVVDSYSMGGSGFSIGDVLTVTDENDSDRLKDFKVREFTIVGTVNTPLYLDYQRGFTDIGNGSLSAFFFIEKEAFDVDYYTDLYVKISSAGEYFSKDVEKAIADVLDGEKESAEELSETVTAARRESEQHKAQEELDEKTQEYEEGLAELEENRAAAENEFARAEREIEDGQALIDSNLETAEAGRQEALGAIKELRTKMTELNDGIDKLNAEKKKAGDGLKKAGEARAQLAQAKTGIDEQTAFLRQTAEEAASQKQKLEEQIAGSEAQTAELQAQAEELRGQISVLEIQIEGLRQEEEKEEDPVRKEEIRQEIAALEEQAAGLGAQLSALETQIAGLEAQTAELRAAAEEAAAQIAALEGQTAALESQSAALEEQIHGVDAEIKKIDDGLALIDGKLDEAESGKTRI